MVVEVKDLNTIREGNVVIDFYTPTCGPCKSLAPVLEAISEEFLDVKIAKVDVTKIPAASQVYGIMSVPTVMFMRDSQVKEVARGFLNKGLLCSMIRRHLKNGHNGNGHGG